MADGRFNPAPPGVQVTENTGVKRTSTESVEDARAGTALFAFPRRRWWFRRVRASERAIAAGTSWTYLFGQRLTVYRYVFRGHRQMVAVYVATKRLNVTWRIAGSLRGE